MVIGAPVGAETLGERMAAHCCSVADEIQCLRDAYTEDYSINFNPNLDPKHPHSTSYYHALQYNDDEVLKPVIVEICKEILTERK